NELGRLSKKTLPLGQTATFAYDAAGRPTRRTTYAGETFFSVYDQDGRLQRVTDGSGNTIENRTYGAKSTTIETAYGTTVLARPTTTSIRVENVTGAVTQYTAIGNNAIQLVTDGRTLTQTFNATGQLTNVSYPNGDDLQLLYDTEQRLTTTRTADGYRREDTFSDGFHLAGSSFYLNDSLVGSMSAIYDDAGRAVDLTLPSGDQHHYEYDLLGRLQTDRLRRSDDTVTTTSYDYDLADNIVSITRDGIVEELEYDANDRLVRRGNVSYTFDDDGKLREIREGASTTTFDYDSREQVTNVVVSDETGPLHSIEYKYESNGLIAARTLDGVTTQYVWD
ncbi:MAG: RHS repeat protein, partial [Planctomycetota bacterium]